MLIHEYDPDWINMFNSIKECLQEKINEFIISTEHVGSTSIPGLSAKPIIDIDIVYSDYGKFSAIENGLQELGYFHNGNQGIPGREVFKRDQQEDKYPILDSISHHLYVCHESNEELKRHITFRDYLKKDDTARMEYQDLKMNLAIKTNNNHKTYAALKETRARDFIERIISTTRQEMNIEYAEKLLNKAEEMNPGKWVDHSRNVAITAQRIASRCDMDSEKAYIMGLLHDIGRRYGKMTIRHGLMGYQFLTKLDFSEYAQICLTHSYTVQNINVYQGIGDYQSDERQFVEEKLTSITYTDYDRLIQLCDFLGIADGFCSIETRICDVINRVGILTENFKNNIFKKFELKAYFEEKYKIDIYEVISRNYSEQLIHL